MAYSPKEFSLISWRKFSTRDFWQNLSLYSLKRISGLLALCIVGGFILFWQPAYAQLRSLQKEKTYWQQALKAGETPSQAEATVEAIPTLDRLPDLIEQCRGVFAKESVEVVSVNVERFGEQFKAGEGEGLSLNYGLVRFRFQGAWEDIVSALQTLEENREAVYHCQEVVLNARAGEALFKIYFRGGK